MYLHISNFFCKPTHNKTPLNSATNEPTIELDNNTSRILYSKRVSQKTISPNFLNVGVCDEVSREVHLSSEVKLYLSLFCRFYHPSGYSIVPINIPVGGLLHSQSKSDMNMDSHAYNMGFHISTECR